MNSLKFDWLKIKSVLNGKSFLKTRRHEEEVLIKRPKLKDFYLNRGLSNIDKSTKTSWEKAL